MEASGQRVSTTNEDNIEFARHDSGCNAAVEKVVTPVNSNGILASELKLTLKRAASAGDTSGGAMHMPSSATPACPSSASPFSATTSSLSCSCEPGPDGANPHGPHVKFTGVRQRGSGRWVAEIKDNIRGVRRWLGTFACPVEAAHAFDAASRALRGARAKTNFQWQPGAEPRGEGGEEAGATPHAPHGGLQQLEGASPPAALHMGAAAAGAHSSGSPCVRAAPAPRLWLPSLAQPQRPLAPGLAGRATCAGSPASASPTSLTPTPAMGQSPALLHLPWHLTRSSRQLPLQSPPAVMGSHAAVKELPRLVAASQRTREEEVEEERRAKRLRSHVTLSLRLGCGAESDGEGEARSESATVCSASNSSAKELEGGSLRLLLDLATRASPSADNMAGGGWVGKAEGGHPEALALALGRKHPLAFAEAAGDLAEQAGAGVQGRWAGQSAEELAQSSGSNASSPREQQPKGQSPGHLLHWRPPPLTEAASAQADSACSTRDGPEEPSGAAEVVQCHSLWAPSRCSPAASCT